MTTPQTREECAALDAADPLAARRAAFALPPGLIYLDGNSLGALTHAAAARTRTLVEQQWGQDLIRSWNEHGWFELPLRLGARIAPLIGADADEVLVADSTSVNLFKLAAAVLRQRGARRRIVTECGNFPTDLYVLQGLAALAGVEVVAVPREQVLAAIDAETCLVVLTHAHYRTAELWDLAAVTRLARARGALVLWDLSHSVGAVPLALGAAGADLAVGCTYKYLNGGPGAPAFLYVRRELQARLEPGLAGWMGHASPFAFVDDYAPATGIARHRAGTPSLVAFAALDGALDAWDGVDLAAVRHKSLQLADLFIARLESIPDSGLALASPRAAAERGSHVSFTHPSAYALVQALIARGVVGDFRAPDIARFGLTPLYLRYIDVWDAAEAVAAVLAAGLDRPEFARRGTVT